MPLLFNSFVSSFTFCSYSLFNLYNLLIDIPLLFNSSNVYCFSFSCSQFNLYNSFSYSSINFFYHLILLLFFDFLYLIHH